MGNSKREMRARGVHRKPPGIRKLEIEHRAFERERGREGWEKD